MTKQQPLVIICDSEDSNIAYYTEIVQALGAACLAANSSASVVELVASHQPALIILDSRLEGPDSYQLLNLLHANPQCWHVPILFMTQNLSEAKMQLHEDLFGLVEVMSKPCNERRLENLLKHYLKQYQLQLEIQQRYQQAQASMSASPDEGILALNRHGQILYANHTAQVLLKTTSFELAGTYLESLLEHPCTQTRSGWMKHPIARMAAADQIVQVEKSSLWRHDGVAIAARFASIPCKSDSGIELLLAFKQLQENRAGSAMAKGKRSKLARFDHLTNLPLRAFVEEHIDRTVLKAGITGMYFAVLLVDLDHFRFINESMGHDNGDRLLKVVAERIQVLLRRDDMVGRMEGDEFVVALGQIEAPENAGMIANKIIESVREPFLINGHELFVGCSIGISVYPNCGDDAVTLMKNATTALTRAKAIGRNQYQYYTVEMNKLRVEQMQLEHELHQALEQKQWRIQYLPVLGEQSAVVACEVKLSWLHPRRGELALDSFLPQAEDAGLAAPLMRWLWQQALEQFEQLKDSSKDKVRLIMPASPVLFLQDGGVDWVINAIGQVGLASDQIFIQIPQSDSCSRQVQQSEVLNELCRNGLNLILDQFGSGFAPLDLLKQVPYALVRLGGSLVADCVESPIDQTLIKGVVEMVHQLGIRVLADGVNSDDQKAFLESIGCDWLSGDAVDRVLDTTPSKLDEMGIFVFPG